MIIPAGQSPGSGIDGGFTSQPRWGGGDEGEGGGGEGEGGGGGAPRAMGTRSRSMRTKEAATRMLGVVAS